MSTSSGSWPSAVLFALLVALAVQIAVILRSVILRSGRRPSVPVVAIGLWLLVAVPSLLQIPFPGLLTALRRDPDLIRHHGQVWRVLTSAVVQDGGLPATAFNLAILAVVGVCAARVWGPVRMPLVFVLVQLVFGLTITFGFPNVGAGNSGATLGLAASLAGPAVLSGRETALRARAFGVLGVGVALVVIGDGHGIAVLAGLLLGLVLAAATERAVPVAAADPA